MKLMMDKLSISQNEAMALGENYNDMEMLEFVGMVRDMAKTPKW